MTKLLPVLLAFGIALTQAATAAEKSSTTKHSDQDEARDALRKGKIMPLTAILEIVAKREPGLVMEVELEAKRERLVYEIEVLTDGGRRRELRLDARSGEILSVKDD